MHAPSQQQQQDRRIDQRLTNVRPDLPPAEHAAEDGRRVDQPVQTLLQHRRENEVGGNIQRLTLVVSFARTVTGLDRAVCDLSLTVYAPGMASRGASPVSPCATT